MTSGTYQRFILGGSRGRYRILKKDSVEALIPAHELPDDVKTGDTLEVFIFLDGKEGLKGTIFKAKACLGDFAVLKVCSVTSFGVFMDWGIKKDLFVPKALLQRELAEGDLALVYLIPDFDGLGVIGSCKIDPYFEKDSCSLKEKQGVDLLVFSQSDLGYGVVVNNKYKGLLYKNEVFEPLNIADRRKGYIKKIRKDGLIDAILQVQGFKEASRDATGIIMEHLEKAGGFLPLHDKSSPQEIKRVLRMSKKIFKRSIGVLYKQNKIRIEDGGIRKL